VAAALTPLLASAAAVLLIAGAAKLRAPGGAVLALRTLGLPAGSTPVRLLAMTEMVLGSACLVHPVAAIVCAVALLYATFAVVGLVLSRRHSACGCFGDAQTPASLAQSIISALLAAIALGGALASAHGVDWVLGRSLGGALALLAAIAGSAYATVLAYTELPSAWVAWEPSRR